MSDTAEVVLGILGVLLVIVICIGVFAFVLMFYGAFFGAIGAGIYLAFKFIVGIFI